MKRLKTILAYFLALLVFITSNGFALKQCLCLCNVCNESHPQLILFDIDDHEHSKDIICMDNHCNGCTSCVNEISKVSTKTNFSFYKLETLFLDKGSVDFYKSQIDLITSLDFTAIISTRINILVYDFSNIYKNLLRHQSKILSISEYLFIENSSLRL